MELGSLAKRNVRVLPPCRVGTFVREPRVGSAFKLKGWLLFSIGLAVGLWQLAQPEPYVAHLVTGLLLLGMGLIAGLRIGHDSAQRFIRNTVRINKHVVQQNHELAELNNRLLRLAKPARHESDVCTHGEERSIEEPC